MNEILLFGISSLEKVNSELDSKLFSVLLHFSKQEIDIFRLKFRRAFSIFPFFNIFQHLSQIKKKMLGLNIELDLKLFTTAYFSKVFKFSLLLFPGKPLFKTFLYRRWLATRCFRFKIADWMWWRLCFLHALLLAIFWKQIINVTFIMHERNGGLMTSAAVKYSVEYSKNIVWNRFS